ncbi:hypothetical protein DRN86_02410 [Candidatus Geothermarchaeota archaeon]|nr:MAG: hypothetical protein DRN86_02410 [Candidatus Geothermarchaeota archaeon]
MISGAELLNIGLTLFIIGFVIVFIAIILSVWSGGGRIKGGGLVLIGPIPIAFGTDKEALKWLMIISLILVIFTISLMVLSFLLR